MRSIGREGFFLPLRQLIVVMEAVNQPPVEVLLARIVRHFNSRSWLKGNKKECQVLEVHVPRQDQLARLFALHQSHRQITGTPEAQVKIRMAQPPSVIAVYGELSWEK